MFPAALFDLDLGQEIMGAPYALRPPACTTDA